MYYRGLAIHLSQARIQILLNGRKRNNGGGGIWNPSSTIKMYIYTKIKQRHYVDSLINIFFLIFTQIKTFLSLIRRVFHNSTIFSRTILQKLLLQHLRPQRLSPFWVQTDTIYFLHIYGTYDTVRTQNGLSPCVSGGRSRYD